MSEIINVTQEELDAAQARIKARKQALEEFFDAATSYVVDVVETIRRRYIVTTTGDESRAAKLAQMGDYGSNLGETVELIEDFDNVIACDVVDVAAEGGAR